MTKDSKKNEDPFLKDLIGVKPIKKKNTLNKIIPEVNTKKIIKKFEIKKNNENLEKTKTTNKILSNLSPMEGNKKLKKGRIKIDKKIDFHGYSAEEAKQIFLNTIFNCFNNNLRCILFVTGKGLLNKSDEPEKKLFYGKIRNSFLEWVNINEVKIKILSVEKADLKNGCDGAFFVYLRKNKN